MAFPVAPEHYRFGPFELQPDNRRLLKDGAAISLRPRAFDLLAALVDRAGHLVTKDELLDQVWPKMVVEEAALHVQVSALRKVLGTEAITTVSGRGYQFTLQVTKADGQADRASKPKHNLPYQLTSFIGREHEIGQLEELVTKNRLVTLTGAGGAGKTRLAIEVTSRLVDAFPDGTWLVELAALSDPRLLAQAVTNTLKVKEQPTRSLIDTLSEYLASKKLLLLLDNVEHLLDACVRLVDEIVRRSRDTTMLVTSRERLGMAGELTYRVPSLTVPGPRDNVAPDALLAYEGVRLFVERARLLRPDFSVTSENAASLASICYHLDGIPLAIELAAPRLRSMSVEELSQGLGQRFALLTDGSRTALPRHRTLRSTIDWSYDLLREPEKLFLQRLSVFAGGWTSAAAEEVCAGEGIEHSDILDLLSSLVDKSLVVPEQEDAQTRYRLLETVRQYARDWLEDDGGSAAVRVRHRDYYLVLAEGAGPKLKGAEQAEWLRRLEDEHENLRAALEWSLVEAAAKGGLRLCGALVRFWWTRGYLTEGQQWCMRALHKAGAEEQTRERASVLNAAGILSYFQGDYPAARALYEESLAISRELGDRSRIASSLNNLGNAALNQRDYPAARALLEESLAIHRELGDRYAIAASLSNLGLVACGSMVPREQADYPAARALHEESLAIRRELGDRQGIAVSLSNLGELALDQGDYPAARARLEESLAIRRELGERAGIAVSLSGLGNIALNQGDFPAARKLFDESLAIRRELGDRRGIAASLNDLGYAALTRGDYRAARAPLEESLAIRREQGDRHGIALSLSNLGHVALNQGDYPAARALYEESLAIRRELGDRSGIAVSLGNLGYVALNQGDYPAARGLLEESLAIRRELGDRYGIPYSLEGLAAVVTSLRDPLRAARIWGAAERLRAEIGLPVPPYERAGYDRYVAAARIASGDDAAFDNAWQEGRSLTLDQAIDLALAKPVEGG